MTNKTKPGIRTEEAIKKWLALPDIGKHASVEGGKIELYTTTIEGPNGEGVIDYIARFKLSDIILKRYPKRKKVKK